MVAALMSLVPVVWSSCTSLTTPLRVSVTEPTAPDPTRPLSSTTISSMSPSVERNDTCHVYPRS
jgi:hypothetical protein